MQATRTIKT